MTETALLKIKNLGMEPLSLDIEPFPDQYTIQPKSSVEIVTELSPRAKTKAYLVHWYPDGLVLFPPDSEDSWNGTKVFCEGKLLEPSKP